MSRGSALIVGVGAWVGLGAAYARRFAREGLGLVIAGRNAEKLADTAERLGAEGATVAVEVGDASLEVDAIRFAERAETVGPLAVAVHNAGSNRRDSVLELQVAAFEALWREHTLGGFLTGREAARRMVPRGEGLILFTGASGSLRGRALFAAFASAKAGVRALSQSFARELGPKGLHVAHLIIDGGIEGDRLLAVMPNLVAERGPAGLLQPDAIAEAAVAIWRQPRSAWTQELDLRPWSESW